MHSRSPLPLIYLYKGFCNPGPTFLNTVTLEVQKRNEKIKSLQCGQTPWDTAKVEIRSLKTTAKQLLVSQSKHQINSIMTAYLKSLGCHNLNMTDQIWVTYIAYKFRLTQERLVHTRVLLNLLLVVPKFFCQYLHTLLVLLILSGHAFWFSLTYLK